MDGSDNVGSERDKALAKDVPKMINLDAEVRKKLDNSEDSIVERARKKSVSELPLDSNEPELDTTESHPNDRKDKPEPRKQLKKKPVVFETIVESELIVGPDDVVIGPSYVLTEIAKSMDKEARDFEPKRQKKIISDQEELRQAEDYNHGFRKRLFTPRIGKPLPPVDADKAINKPFLMGSKSGKNFQLKRNPKFSTLHRKRFEHLNPVEKKIRFRLPKFGRLRKSNAPHFFNTSKDLKTISPSQPHTITIQYSNRLLNRDKLYVTDMQIESIPGELSPFERLAENIKITVSNMNETPMLWFYLLAPTVIFCVLIFR
tara:strand:- start:340 stop:1290 length:951 start_codon:yes stop_codon:yes gene_type:complete